MKKQKQYYINGLILIITGVFAVTVLPYLTDKIGFYFDKSVFSEFEFFVLVAAGLFYLFSPKYYKSQMLSIILAIIFYLIFSNIYHTL